MACDGVCWISVDITLSMHRKMCFY
jgi:hypothetical protein